MKMILYIKKVMMLLMALAFPMFALAESITYTAIYDYSNFTIGNDTLAGEAYAIVSYEGLHNDGAPGAPSLPIDYIRFSVPYNASNFTVSTMTIASGVTDIGLAPYPCQAPVPINRDGDYTIILPDSNIYNSGEYYPSLTENAWIVDEGFLAGENHVVTVAIMPISYRYRAAQNLLRKSRQVNITLSYDLSTSTQFSPILTVNSQDRIEGQQLTQSMVVNPNSVSAFAPPQSLTTLLNSNGQYAGPAVTNGLTSFPYLIITTPELSHSLRRIVALKKQKGYNVKVATVDEIMSDPYAQNGDIININGIPTVTFGDSAGVIREYLRLARYYNQSKYLLLAGTDIPYRMRKYGTDSISTDLYYSDLNANWLVNAIDKNPEYYVGRILAKSDNQIKDFTDKQFRYELNPGKGDHTYLKRALYTESLDLTNCSSKIRNWMDFICPEPNVIQEIAYGNYPKATDIIDSINTRQYGFWATYNHGEPSCIAACGVISSGVYARRFYRFMAIDSVHISASNYSYPETDNGLNNISNKDFPMVSYSVSCRTMPFNVISETYRNLPMNFGESFTTGKDYGGPAYLGNTWDGYIGSSSSLAECFSKKLYDGFYKLGEAEALSKLDYNGSSHIYLSYVHNLLGDPTLEMWTDIPQQYTNIGITRTDNSISINGIDSDSTIVAFFSNDGQVNTDTISISSAVFSAISPNSTIMLYKHNHIPYIAPLELQNITFSNNQYVIANDVIAGSAIDTNRTNGYVIVPDGIEYEIEASGKVLLEDGFSVENGASFAVYPSSF